MLKIFLIFLLFLQLAIIANAGGGTIIRRKIHAHSNRPAQGELQLPLDFPHQLVSITLDSTEQIQFAHRRDGKGELELELEFSASLLKVQPAHFMLGPGQNVSVQVTGLGLASRTFIDLANCSLRNASGSHPCPFDKNEVFVAVIVAKSSLISVLVVLSGWIYFVAWSISFYPQIILNWQRKSVIGLNFDFLVLNVIGFACYTVYNVLLYFDLNVQDLYLEEHGQRSLIPVLLNDVVFASHAFVACLITGFQCFIYERGNQRVSYTCRVWASFLLCFSAVCLALGLLQTLNWLKFIEYLAFVKMAVTLSKYFPQAILNFRRKSTVGWSIGNVLLDFSGGSMDICQMVLQASNTADWSAFLGNPVKFGLGLISMLFDVLFMFQHYLLYPHKETSVYNQVDSSDGSSTPPRPPTLAISLGHAHPIESEPAVAP